MAENASSPSHEEQPDAKRLKLSSAGDDQIQENAPALPKKPRYKRRKIAIFFAFCGVGYQGMQKNPGAKTIEGDLEEALYHSGAVPEQERGQSRRWDWGRSARTDKGVSAACQVVSGRFYVDPPGFVERLNSNLSPQIRIFGYKRVTQSFSAKKFCDRRRYVYMIPVFALNPSSHRDSDSVESDLRVENEINKCSECSGKANKVSFLTRRRNVEFKIAVEAAEALSGISSNTETASAENLPSSDNTEAVNTDNNGDGSTASIATEKASENGEKNVDLFQYGDGERERFNRILKYYEGTHNFHNFTTRTKAEDPSANRYILSFNANTVVNIDGIDFVKCEVTGQSFMLHQIRKMIGLAVAIMRGSAPESLIETAFDRKADINAPMAPEVGLYLDECFFTSYNKKWGDSHEELSMKDYMEEAEEFKKKYIYSYIASSEKEDAVVALWLHFLNHHKFQDHSNVDNTPSSGLVEADKDNSPSSNVEPSEVVTWMSES